VHGDRLSALERWVRVLSAFDTQERLQQNEWIAVGLAGVGIVGLGISSEEEPEDVQIHPFRILVRGLCSARAPVLGYWCIKRRSV
jgi:hypothetical protein